jgi:outer membrane protein OmpA-like peptidoglycan-associated protein
MFLLFLGCKENSYDKNSVALVIIGGKHANIGSFRMPDKFFFHIDGSDSSSNDEKPSFLEDNFLRTNMKVVTLNSILVDGLPTVERISMPDHNGVPWDEYFEKAIRNSKWDIVQGETEKYIQRLADTPTDDEEVDTFRALYEAGIYLDNYKNFEKKILIFDSGLCTSGYLNFVEYSNRKIIMGTDIIDNEKVSTIVDKLTQEYEFPNLHGANILWYGLGQVGGDQQEVNRNNLEAIWKAILEKSEAEVIFRPLNNAGSNVSDEGLKNVSVVLPIEGEDVPLGEEELGFEPGLSTFLKGTEQKRKEILNKFVQEGKTNGLLLVGTTSDGGASGDGLELSWQRAEAVKEELVKLNVPARMIETLGLGTKHHRYDSSEFVNGVYKGNSEAAQKNRSVRIMSSQSSEYTQFHLDYKKLSGTYKVDLGASRNFVYTKFYPTSSVTLADQIEKLWDLHL